MRFLPDRPDRHHWRVAVVGLGYVGSCLAAALADRGLDVVGIDVDPHLIAELNGDYCRFREEELGELMLAAMAAGSLRVTTDYAAAAAADVVLIAVGTPVQDDGSLAPEQLSAACAQLSPHVRDGQLIILKSTVPPGTTRSLVRPLLERGGRHAGLDFGLAFTPERLAEGTAMRELRTFPMVAGGLDADSARAAATFWRTALGVEVTELDSLESAEIVKLADNWWIDLNIALGNELAKFCALFDVDVLDVITAANSIPKGTGHVNILLPSVGVGGSCLTKDPYMIWQSARGRGLDIRTALAGREVNAGMPGYTAQLIIDTLATLGKDPAGARIAVLGLAFKNNTGDLRATPVRGAVAALAQAGADIRIFDPLVDTAQAAELFGIKPSATMLDAVLDADCIAVLALHREFEGIDFAVLPVAASCVIVDGRAYYAKEKIAELTAQGYIYRGIGRRA
jgi:dTDP-alpha-D-glucose dehydrogenase